MHMKKLIILGAVLLATAAVQAQNNEKTKSKSSSTVTTAPPATNAATMQSTPQPAQVNDEKKESQSHWEAAKRQLESAKDHLKKATFDPGAERENAIRSIEAALAEVNNVLAQKHNAPPRPLNQQGHDQSDPNHKH